MHLLILACMLLCIGTAQAESAPALSTHEPMRHDFVPQPLEEYAAEQVQALRIKERAIIENAQPRRYRLKVWALTGLMSAGALTAGMGILHLAGGDNAPGVAAVGAGAALALIGGMALLFVKRRGRKALVPHQETLRVLRLERAHWDRVLKESRQRAHPD